MTKPYGTVTGSGEDDDETVSGDQWNWTLGQDQYDWFKQTLETSNARYKFVFSHHVVGGQLETGGAAGPPEYVRGGALAVPYFEWGGNNADDTWGFDTERSGWGDDPIHQLMVANNVSAFFHGHDHQFVHEEIDGIVYQLVPSASMTGYGFDLYDSSPYAVSGGNLPNAGHVRVTVSPDETTVEYVRSAISGDTGVTNGEVSHLYTIEGGPTTYDLTLAVDPSGSGTTDPVVGVHTYVEGAVVAITATPNEGYEFDHWTGDVADPNAASTTVTMDGEKTVTAHFTSGPPPAATLISPVGIISDTTPTYTWGEVATATWYKLWVDGPSGTLINQWYRAEDANCAEGVCAVTPATVLSEGEHAWWVQTWNDAGYGPWSTPLGFYVGELSLPGPATLAAPTGPISDPSPIYTWGAVETASWYRVWVEDALGVVLNQWYRSEQVCAAGSCSVEPSLELGEGPYMWWVRTWNMVGLGPWSAPLDFYVGTPGAPGPATLSSPSGAISEATPSYTWEMVGTATWYRLLVEGPSGTVVNQWYKAANVCVRAGGACEATPGVVLEAGEHSWWVKSWNPYGSTWSGRLDFNVTPGAAGLSATPSSPGVSDYVYRLYLPLMLKSGETGDTPPAGPPLDDGDEGPPPEMLVPGSGPAEVDEDSGPPLEELGPGSGPPPGADESDGPPVDGR